MEQTIFAKQDRPLLTYAISKLNPDIFSHPIWVRFGRRAEPIQCQVVLNILDHAEELQRDNPGDACQLMFISAAYQSHANQWDCALTTIENILNLATRAGLTTELHCAYWGACAVCVQQGNYELADRHFRHLQSSLYEQKEWILADYVDMVRQYFLSPWNAEEAGFSSADEGQELTTMLSTTSKFLYKWGVFSQRDFDPTGSQSMEDTSMKASMKRSESPPEEQPGPWHTLKLMFQGELKLHWIKNISPPARERSSVWQSIQEWLGIHHPGQQRAAEIIEAKPQMTGPLKPGMDPINLLPGPTPQTEKAEPEDNPVKSKPVEQTISIPSLSVHMLGKFEMSIQDVTCKLPASRSLSLLKYLLLHHRQSIPREILMDIFWPETAPETARNNLNVAIHSLRKALRFVIFTPVIVYENGAYGLDPDLEIWLDVEEFENSVNAGKRFEARNQIKAAVAQYEAAISLYPGDFLEQDPYEEWTIHDRERLRAAYLDMIERLSRIYFNQENYAACINVCQRILSYDSCREDAYCLLMRCYSRQGQSHLALRQYQNCVKALHSELEVDPAPETTKVYNKIRRREQV